MHYWIIVQSGDDFEIESAPVDNGVFLVYTLPISQPGNEGKNFRFKVAAENMLGRGPFSIGTVLMAVNPPDAPTIGVDELTRTLTSIYLKFIPGASNGGSLITGYLLYRDQGVAGSPFELIYNGTKAPEMILYNVTGLMTGHYYNFKLFSMNEIYVSELFGSIKVLIATIPAQPKKPEFVTASLSGKTIKVTWDEPMYIGGIPMDRYDLWIDNGAGVWSTTPISFNPPAGDKIFQYTFTLLTPGLYYQIMVQAVNEIGASLTSEVSYFVCADIPLPPSAPILEATTSTSISVTWNEPVNNGGSPISGYRLIMNDLLADDVFSLIYDGANYPARLSFTKYGLTPGKYYRFKVSSMNKNGESAPSAESKFLAADFPASPS